MRDAAESTKVRIAFDASARADNKSPSLNDCLETGPSLQNLIRDNPLRKALTASNPHWRPKADISKDPNKKTRLKANFQ